MTLSTPKTKEASPATSTLIAWETSPVLPARQVVEVPKPQLWRTVAATTVDISKGTVGTVAAVAGFFAGMGGPTAGMLALSNGHGLEALAMAGGGLAIAGALFAIAERWAPTALAVVSGGAYQPGGNKPLSYLSVLAGTK